jgi:DNA repair protein RadC
MAADREAKQRPLTSLQERLVRSGFDGFKDQEIIELLLSAGLPPSECRLWAKKFIRKFGTLRGFLAAPAQELKQIGVTRRGMFYIRLLHELPEVVLKQKLIAQPIYQSSKEIFDYLYYSMRDLKKEIFKVIYLNNRNQIIDTADLFQGTLETIPICPREIVESAIKNGAAGLVFVHNHPTGDPKASKSDKQLTRDMVFIGMILQIKVLDHIIIGGDTYYSFADAGLIQKHEDAFLNLKIKSVFLPSADRVPPNQC